MAPCLFRAIVRTAALTHWRHHCTRVSAPANDFNHFEHE
ncbi:hypothetical protein EDF56_101171 [Novosphingobium sp. PhB165]|nr:hypothetical protein EDF56_101171 [Novosphingobium sp. PhB165]